MSFDLESRMDMIQSPILETTGLEIFEAFSIDTVEGKVDLDQDAIDCIDQLIEDRFLVITAFGPNGSGKGGLLKGFMRIFQQSEHLRRSFARRGIQLAIQRYPFSLMDDCVQLPGTPPEFFIPPKFNPETYTFEHTQKAASYQRHLFVERALPRLNNPKLATVALIEGSAFLAYPTNTEIPVTMKGVQDLGISTISSLFFDDRTRPYSKVYAVDRDDERVRGSALDTRIVLHSDRFDPQRSFQVLPDNMVISVGNGKEVEVSKLPIDVQAKVRAFVLKTQAPPNAITRLDRESVEFRRTLYQTGLISSDENSALFEFFARRLGIWETDQFTILKNGYRAGRKTDDLSYFTESEPVKAHPAILDPLDLEEVQRFGRKLLRAAS